MSAARAHLMDGSVRTGVIRDYVALTKPGIVLWLVITAFAAMVVAGHGIPGAAITLVTLGGLAMSAGGAHAVNMWFDRDIDQLMERTEHRPVPAGRLSPRAALLFGIALGSASLAVMGLLGNWPSAIATAAGYLCYVFVYTIWLKRRTPQNIVIGGVAGAMPPVAGWLAVSPHLAWPPVLMFLIISLWTPPHFWSLALYRCEDYRRAGVPMMPAVRGARPTIRASFAYTILLVAASLALGLSGTVGSVYFLVAVIAGALFLLVQVALWRDPVRLTLWARRTFLVSLVYIVALFLAMPVTLRF